MRKGCREFSRLTSYRNILLLSTAVVVNTDEIYFPGKHWVAFYRNEFGVLECFDSFGRNPSDYSPWIKQFTKLFTTVVVNDKTIQSVQSSFCGMVWYIGCLTSQLTIFQSYM